MQAITKKAGRLSSRSLSLPYRSDVRLFETWLSGRSVNAESVKQYFTELKNSVSVSTFSRKKSALKKAIQGARGQSLTLAESAQLTVLFSEIKTGKTDKTVHEHEILSRDELTEILETSGEKTSAIIAALYETAARVSELLALRLADCEVRGEDVYCRIRNGKGQKERTTYMSSDTFGNLKKLYAGKVHLVESNGKTLSRHTVKIMIKRAGVKSGRPDLHPHMLRHTKATHLLADGMSLPAVSAYCGHSDPTITAKFYLHDKPTADAVLRTRKTK